MYLEFCLQLILIVFCILLVHVVIKTPSLNLIELNVPILRTGLLALIHFLHAHTTKGLSFQSMGIIVTADRAVPMNNSQTVFRLGQHRFGFLCKQIWRLEWGLCFLRPTEHCIHNRGFLLFLRIRILVQNRTETSKQQIWC